MSLDRSRHAPEVASSPNYAFCVRCGYTVYTRQGGGTADGIDGAILEVIRAHDPKEVRK